MNDKSFVANIGDGSTSISVRNGDNDTLDKVFELLKTRGFDIQTDQRILKEFPILADRHWEGNKGDLLFKAEIYPAGFKLEFYQEIIKKNPNGGYYDFDKLKMMPYLIRCQYIVERKHICNLLENEGYVDDTKPAFKNAFDDVMNRIKSCWHYKEGKELPEYELPSYNARDRDEKQTYNGQIKYFRDYKGRLKRGTVYHNINNTWWVILNKREFTNVAAFKLFDITKEEDLKPKIYSRKMPQRVKAEKLRSRFNSHFSYSMLREIHIEHLRLLVSQELANHDKEMDMSVKIPRKKDTVVLKTKGLKFAAINVKGSYFADREGITFNQNGFIGFAGWASNNNVRPFVSAFEKWMNWLKESVENVA